MTTDKNHQKNTEEKPPIYISIDHLKKGAYKLHLMCKEKIVKTINFKK